MIVGVLQGRFKKANIELVSGMQPSTSQSVTAFLQEGAHYEIRELKSLLEAAEKLCNENSTINREEFLEQIREYAKVEEIV